VLRAGLADRDVVRIRRGDGALVRFDAFPDREWRGTVTEIAAAADSGTGTFRVEVGLADTGDLTAGMVGRVEIAPSSGRLTPVVPIEAILEADGDEATVFALSPDGSRAERRRITVAWLAGDRVAVTSGLEGVTSVLTDGAAYVENGGAVKVVR
jgi:RND family efflux transporter MFP subunit